MLAGYFGIGGGAVIVPVLYEVFRLLGVPEEVRMQLCVGASIAIIVPTTIRSYLTHREKGLVVPAGDPAVGRARGAWRHLRRHHRGLRTGSRVPRSPLPLSQPSSRSNFCLPEIAGTWATSCPAPR